MPLPLEYCSVVTIPSKAMTPIAVACVAVLVLLVNSALVASVIRDGPNGPFGGWADVGVVVGLGPLCNGLLLLVALGCAPLVKHFSGGRPIAKYVVASILFPAAGYAADYLLITGAFLR
jgi:hypothetical protein